MIIESYYVEDRLHYLSNKESEISKHLPVVQSRLNSETDLFLKRTYRQVKEDFEKQIKNICEERHLLLG
jgi:hypothetical protein